jgi:ketopantoate hydroxymethyltransferase
MSDAFRRFMGEVQEGTFPSAKESFAMDESILAGL